MSFTAGRHATGYQWASVPDEDNAVLVEFLDEKDKIFFLFKLSFDNTGEYQLTFYNNPERVSMPLSFFAEAIEFGKGNLYKTEDEIQ